MTRLEMVEKIREKTGVTYEEAREALEKANWDMLDAIVSLEKDKPAAEPIAEPVFVQENAGGAASVKKSVRRVNTGEIGSKIASALRWIGALIKKGENNHLEVSYKDDVVIEISLVSLILIFLLSWWLPAILIVVGLFTGYKFRVTASGAAGRIVNTVSEKASQKADEIVNKMNEEKEEE